MPEGVVPAGAITHVVVDGEELVVWRTARGPNGSAVCAHQRRCPHLDEDLTEGHVQGDELVCAAHGWSIDCDGNVFKRNEAGRIDPKGSIHTWQTRDVDGKISVRSESDLWIDVDS